MVENSKLEQVRVIEEHREKYATEQYILRWTLPKVHDKRILYLLFDNQRELNSWLYMFNEYKQVYTYCFLSVYTYYILWLVAAFPARGCNVYFIDIPPLILLISEGSIKNSRATHCLFLELFTAKLHNIFAYFVAEVSIFMYEIYAGIWRDLEIKFFSKPKNFKISFLKTDLCAD